MHAVILSGGSGTRLWPLFREAYPKQFLALNTEESLLGETLQRACTVPDCKSISVITNEEHRFIVAAHLQRYSTGTETGRILLEPVGRNTAPAIALAALQVQHSDPDGLMLVLPSDHVVQDNRSFLEAVQHGASAAQDGHLVTFGVIPTSAHTGYGYIKADSSAPQASAYPVDAFVEKPDAETAESYVRDGRYYWNSGMFLFKARDYLEELENHRPDILKACQEAWDTRTGDLDFVRVSEKEFAACPKDFIDYAVMENTEKSVVVPMNAGWSNVGSWSSLWELQDRDRNENVIRGDVVTENVHSSYLHSESRLIAAIGVDNHVIIETDDVVLVVDRNRVKDVKKLVVQLQEKERTDHRFHRKVHRPWGSYEGVARSNRFQVKRITVNPGSTLSLQKHHHRSEHCGVRGTALVTQGENETLLTEDQSTYIPLGVVHRLSNPGVIPLEVIEVQTGSYLGEDDSVRIQDDYNRS